MTSLGIQGSRNLDYTVGATGVFALGLGLTALVNPLLFLPVFNLQATSPEARKVAKDLLIVYAARDLALGSGIMAAAYYGHKEIMGCSMVGASVVALLDGLVSGGNEKGAGWKHWGFIGVSLGLALACFGYI